MARDSNYADIVIFLLQNASKPFHNLNWAIGFCVVGSISIVIGAYMAPDATQTVGSSAFAEPLTVKIMAVVALMLLVLGLIANLLGMSGLVAHGVRDWRRYR